MQCERVTEKKEIAQHIATLLSLFFFVFCRSVPPH